jgi:tetraacyldisaccharide 4'-kinase
MNFNFYLLKSFRILLFPFALVYGLVVRMRNWLYDIKWYPTTQFNLPMICIGNLSMGGTGKSPMTEYVIRLLKDQYKVASLSRGYKRQSEGYMLANTNTNALEIGDEPMQFHLKFPDVAIAVGEQRVEAIPQLLHDKPATQCIILDDAFQHRAVSAGLNIVLTEYSNLFTRDFYLPTGDLRDSRSSIKRAQIIVVTKCPETITENDKERITDEIDPTENQHLFFTSIVYGQPYHILHKNNDYIITHDVEVLLVCGIANPKPLKQYLTQKSKAFYLQAYNDHHAFTKEDVLEIKKKFSQFTTPYKIILTTEKDAVRFQRFDDLLTDLPFFVLPIEHQFLFGEGEKFDGLVKGFIDEWETNVKM